MYTKKFQYKHFTQFFLLQNNLCEFTIQEHKFKKWFCTQLVCFKDFWNTKINLSLEYLIFLVVMDVQQLSGFWNMILNSYNNLTGLDPATYQSNSNMVIQKKFYNRETNSEASRVIQQMYIQPPSFLCNSNNYPFS